MGEFTQNLLKLTEFPFSYSLIGLLALIFGQGINVEELSFVRIGPLLILMGFVATTLSICDPVGALQRLIIRGKRFKRNKGIHDFFYEGIFDYVVITLFPLAYIFAIRYSPEEMKRFKIDWSLFNQDFQDEKGGSRSLPIINAAEAQFAEIGVGFFEGGVEQIRWLLKGLKQQTVKTKWITAEIDRITALIYFIVTISVFIVAIVHLPDILHKFSQVFQDTEQIRIGILIFSTLALGAVTYMLIVRIRGLLHKASIVFRHLTALGAIKTEKERFKPISQEIEQYLNNNDWILSEYWVNRIQDEYTEVFLDKVTSHTGQSKSYGRGPLNHQNLI